MADNFERDQARGSRAQQILDDELFTEAFKALEASYIETWKQTTVLDTASREKLHLAVNMIGKVRQHLHLIVANGQLAKKQLDDIARTGERKIFSIR